jgi:hypothetical protein
MLNETYTVNGRKGTKRKMWKIKPTEDTVGKGRQTNEMERTN